MVRPQLNAEELRVPSRPREPKVVGRNNADFPSGSLEWSPPPAPPLSTLFLDLGAFPVGTQYLTMSLSGFSVLEGTLAQQGVTATLMTCQRCLGAPESCVHCHPLLF